MEQPDALILTAIGIGAAFCALALLFVTALIIGPIGRTLARRSDGGAGAETTDDAPPATSDPEMRNRARAAAIAVTALIESQPRLGRSRRRRDE